MSDRCRSSLGRRRPFILLLSVGIVLGQWSRRYPRWCFKGKMCRIGMFLSDYTQYTCFAMRVKNRILVYMVYIAIREATLR